MTSMAPRSRNKRRERQATTLLGEVKIFQGGSNTSEIFGPGVPLFGGSKYYVTRPWPFSITLLTAEIRQRLESLNYFGILLSWQVCISW